MPTYQQYVKYAASASYGITIASLASDTNLLVGQEGPLIDNSVLGYDDYIVGGFVQVASAGALTANRSIELWAVAPISDSLWPSPFAGSNAGRTIALQANKNNICYLVWSALTTSTNSSVYRFSGRSIRQVFRGALPEKFTLFLTQNTGQSLDSTAGNHAIHIKGVYPQFATV